MSLLVCKQLSKYTVSDYGSPNSVTISVNSRIRRPIIKLKIYKLQLSEKINTQLNTHERQFFLVPICKPDVRVSIESKSEMECKWLTSDDWTQSLFEWQKLYEYKVWYSSDYSDNSTWNLLPTGCRSCIKQSLVFRWLQNKCGVK